MPEPHIAECPNCHDANKYGDYEGPTCEVCGGRGSVSNALADVAAERQRQIEVEGWTSSHDDSHDKCEMARAAACYALAPSPVGIEREWVAPDTPPNWPWHFSWWKPGFYRQNLVKAAALLIAEIERWDRLVANQRLSRSA